MGYTDDEIRTTVEKLVVSSIRRPINSLGTRDIDATFSDIQQTAAGVFMLYARAPFYTIYLGAQRLLEAIRATQLDFDNLITALGVLRRKLLPVRDVASLVNAKVALFELESAVAKQAISDVTRVPAYVRFNQNVDRFLKQATAIKYNGNIVPTPEEARGLIPGYVSTIKSSMQVIVEKAQYLRDAIQDFNDTNLPKIVSTSVISKSRQVVDERATQMEGLDEKARMEVLREVVLDLLGTKAAVTKFGQSPSMDSAISVSGTAAAFADNTRLAIPAALQGEKNGPYCMVVSDTIGSSTYDLKLWLDGDEPPVGTYDNPTVELFLPQSFYARLECQLSEPYNISSTTNEFRVSVNGAADTVITLPSGVNKTADDIVTAISTALTATRFKAEKYYSPLKYDGFVDVPANNKIRHPLADDPNNANFPIDPATGQSYLQVGDKITFYKSSVGNTGMTVTITDIQNRSGVTDLAHPQQFIVTPATLNVHTTPIDAQPTEAVRVGPALQRVRLVPKNNVDAISYRDRIQVKTPTNLARDSAAAIGFYGEQISESRPTDASTLATYINQNSTRITAAAKHLPVFTDVQVRTDPSSASRMTAFYLRTTADWPDTSGPGSAVLTLAAAPSTTLVGSTIVLRTGYEVDACGLITTINGCQVTATFSVQLHGVQGGQIEIGPSSGIERDHRVVIPTGNLAGSYYIDEVLTVPFDFVLRDQLPKYMDGYGLPEYSRGNIGPETLVLSSTNKTSATKVLMYDEPKLLFSTTEEHAAVGTTKYLQLAVLPKNLELGDIFSHHVDSHLTPTLTGTVDAINSDKVLTLSVYVPTNFTTNFGNALPYSRLKKSKIVDFDGFKANLVTWLSQQDIDLDWYFIDLNRYINPLLQNDNPEGYAVSAAANRVMDLYALVLQDAATDHGKDASLTLEAYLSAYEIDSVSEIDALIKTFLERGADRAVDYLLEGRFTSFFGLSRDEVSYAGMMQKTLQDVARSDLPVSKVQRYEQRIGPLVGSGESPDYEFDSSDLDPTPNPDAPDL